MVDTVRDFVEKELYPLEDEVERSGQVPRGLGREIQDKVIDLGFYAPNIPEEFGGGGLDTLTFARRDGDDYVINGTKHFISHGDVADFVITFAATGEDETEKGPKKRITCFLVDRGTPGFEMRPGYNSVSHRGYHNTTLTFDDCRVPASRVLGEEGEGFDLTNAWRAAVSTFVWTGPPTAASSVSRSAGSRASLSNLPTCLPGSTLRTG